MIGICWPVGDKRLVAATEGTGVARRDLGTYGV